MKRRRKVTVLGVALLLVIALMGSLSACKGKEKEEADVKEKLDKANEKVQELEEEDEKDREFVFREEETGAVLTAYNGTAEEVVIPEEYNGLAVVKIDNQVFRNNDTVKVIQIPPTVTGIQPSAIREESGIILRGYSNTFAEYFAMNRGLTFESVGENTFETDSVTIWDKDGAHCTTIYRGQAIEDEKLAGVEFKKVDGKSVLVLNNCDIGSIEVKEFAALTIELASGSENKIAGARGKDGIWSYGNLTIKGDGKLSIFGGDFYGIVDGAGTGSYVGGGLLAEGNLNIEENAKVYAKAGNGKKEYYAIGVASYGGIITVSGNGMLEAVSGDNEGSQSPAILASSFILSDGSARGGEIVLNEVKLTGGGQIVPFVYRGTYEDTGEAYEETGGQSISGAGEVSFIEEQGYTGASTHIIIGQ